MLHWVRYPRISGLLFFVFLSSGLHFCFLLVDVSPQAVSAGSQQVSIGLIQRPMARFTQVGLATLPIENDPLAQQSSAKSEQQPTSENAKANTAKVAMAKISVDQEKVAVVQADPVVRKVLAPAQADRTESRIVESTLVGEPQTSLLQIDSAPQTYVSPTTFTSADNNSSLTVSNAPRADVKEVRSREDELSAGSEQLMVDNLTRMEQGAGEASEELAAISESMGPIDFQDALPRYELNPRPRYPEVALRRGQQGTVFLKVAVLANGQVETTSLHESSGYRSLDRAALSAVRRWQFKPATSAGLAVESQVVVPIDFVLSEN